MAKAYKGKHLAKEYEELGDLALKFGYLIDKNVFFGMVHNVPELGGLSKRALMDPLLKGKENYNVPPEEMAFIEGYKSRMTGAAQRVLPNGKNVLRDMLSKEDIMAANQVIESNPELLRPLRCTKWAMLSSVEMVEKAAAKVTRKPVAVIGRERIEKEINRKFGKSHAFGGALEKSETVSFKVELRQEADRLAGLGDAKVYRGFICSRTQKTKSAPIKHVRELRDRLERKMRMYDWWHSGMLNDAALSREIRKKTKNVYSDDQIRSMFARERRKNGDAPKEVAAVLRKIVDSNDGELYRRLYIDRMSEPGVPVGRLKRVVGLCRKKYPGVKKKTFMRAVRSRLKEEFNINYSVEALTRAIEGGTRLRTVRPEVVEVAEAVKSYVEKGLTGEERFKETKEYLDKFTLPQPRELPELPSILEMESYGLEMDEMDYLCTVVESSVRCARNGDKALVDPNFAALMGEITRKDRLEHLDSDIDYAINIFQAAAESAARSDNGYSTKQEYLKAAADFSKNYTDNGFTLDEFRGFLGRLEREIGVA